MGDSEQTLNDPGTGRQRGLARLGPWASPLLPLTAILLVAAGLRLCNLGRTSLWYDEVVTMRVARAANPVAMVRLLDQIDGTRAPLHPLVLHAWLKLFGSSDFAGRSFSALCGLVTVFITYGIGRRAFDDRTASGLPGWSRSARRWSITRRKLGCMPGWCS